MAILADDASEQDLDLASVWQRLRDLRLRRVEVFTMTRSEFDEWKRSLGTLAEIVASTGVVVHGDDGQAQGRPQRRRDARLDQGDPQPREQRGGSNSPAAQTPRLP